MLWGILLALGLAAAWGSLERGPLTVSAAISLTDVLNEIVATYGRAGGGAVRLNLAGSNTLARQIVNGAPADLFISADARQMDVAAAAGAIDPATRVDVLGNRLAVVAAPERLEAIRSSFLRAPPEIRRLALGDPSAVPAGVYARQYLESKGLWARYASRVVPTANVRGALAAVDNGSADAAIVYATDARVARRAGVAFVVPDEDSPRIAYPAAITASTRQRLAAEHFLTFLRGPAAAAIFAKHGFVPLRQ